MLSFELRTVHVTDKVRDPVDAQHAGLVERHALELRELGRAGIAHLIHEAVDRDLVALVLQRRERPDQTPGRVRNDRRKRAVRIFRRAPDAKLDVRDALEPTRDGRTTGGIFVAGLPDATVRA